MDERDAAAELADQELVALVEGAIASVKQLRDRCLAEEVPVLVARPPKAGKG